jgi:hypothetical protein
MHLSFWIRASYCENQWKGEMKEKRIKAAEELLENRKARNQEISLLECLQFCDKRDPVISREDLRSKPGPGSKTASKSLLERAENLRNSLAHSQLDLAEGRTWKETISTIQNLEALVHKSDQLVEERASVLAENQDGNMLWASA